MDRFVKNFIAMSIAYLTGASVLGVMMLVYPSLLSLRFVHSHLMLLGWVSMMIYGVGYHILPRFAGKTIKSKAMGELQFWLSNIGLVAMLAFYTLLQYNPEVSAYRMLMTASGIIVGASILLFFYNMMVTIYGKES